MELTQYLKEIEKLDKLQNNGADIDQLKILLQTDNTKIALYNDVIDSIIKTWNKYENKQLGDKTKEKIKLEIEAIFDNTIFVYISKNEFRVYTRDITKRFNGRTLIEITTKNWKYNTTTEDNKIKQISKDMFMERNTYNNYTENIEETANEIISLHKQALQLQEQLNAVYANINKLSNYKQQAVQYTSSVRNYII